MRVTRYSFELFKWNVLVVDTVSTNRLIYLDISQSSLVLPIVRY